MLTVMKGIICSGKSTMVQGKDNVLSSDALRHSLSLSRTDKSVFGIMQTRARELMKNGEDVIIDATNLSYKRDMEYTNIAKSLDVETVCNYVITHPTRWKENALERLSGRWSDMTYNELLAIRKQMYTSMQLFGTDWYDTVSVNISNIKIERWDAVDAFVDYYENNKDMFLASTEEFFANLQKRDIVTHAIPEIACMYGFNQESKYHNKSLEQHTFKACEAFNDEEMVWTMLLHDTGKMVEGIKQGGQYAGHAGASAEIAFCVLSRLGIFDDEKIFNIAKNVCGHMLLPFQGELSDKVKNLLPEGYFEKLSRIRKADQGAH